MLLFKRNDVLDILPNGSCAKMLTTKKLKMKRSIILGPVTNFCVNGFFTRTPCPHRLSQSLGIPCLWQVIHEAPTPPFSAIMTV